MILFRVDATPAIGSGHAMRCLALAEAWRRTRDPVMFVSAGEGAAHGLGIDTLPITAAVGSPEDAEQTAAFVRERSAQWLVLDGYQFDAEYQAALKAAGCRLLVIDDHGRAGAYVADLVLDQNVDAQASRYANCSAGTELLLGLNFALLRESFTRWRTWRRVVEARATRVLVTFGGADPVNATAAVLQALAPLPDLDIIAVVGPHNAHPLPAWPRVQYARGLSDLSELMVACDLAITAAGSTCWELAFLQTPMIVLAIADNQRPIAAGLAAHGAAVDLGWHADVTPEHISATVSELIQDCDRREALAAAGRGLVDGEGAARVVTRMKKALISLRPATSGDSRRVWEWSNERAVREASFRSEPIPWENHAAWFDERLHDAVTKFYIAETDCPIGQTRFALGENGEATISTSLDTAQRGRGFGSAVILAACERLFAETPASLVRALIKPHNDASLQAFSRAGFHRVQDVRIGGEPAAQFILEREAA